MLLRRLLLIALVLAPLGAAQVAAHQQKIAISTIAINPRSAMIEIVHQVPVHDAEHALRTGGAKNPDIIGSGQSREAFARYVTRRFMLQVDGTSVEPAYVGSEITGGSLMVYQETPAPSATAPGGATPVKVNSQIFTDIWARQENRVNIGSGTRVTTLIFKSGDPPQSASLPRG